MTRLIVFLAISAILVFGGTEAQAQTQPPAKAEVDSTNHRGEKRNHHRRFRLLPRFGRHHHHHGGHGKGKGSHEHSAKHHHSEQQQSKTENK